MLGRQCQSHRLITTVDLHRQVEGGHVQFGVRCLMCLLNHPLEQGQYVVGEQRCGKPQQRRAGMAQALDLAVQYRLKPLEHAFDTPALAVQARNRGRLDVRWEIAPQSNVRIPRLCGR